MKLATTTGDFDNYCDTYEEKICCLHAAGFRYIDLNLYRELKDTDFTLCDNWKENILSLKKLATELGMEFVQAHSVGGNPLAKDEKWEMLVKSTIRSVEVCGMLGIPSTVVHAGWMPKIGKEEYFERNLEFFRRIFPAMEATGVNVLIENSTKANMGDQYYFLTGADMKDFIRYAGHPLLHACWDTGHANIEGHQYQDLVDLGEDLYGLHINDNRGEKDEHIMPFCGTLNMDEVMHGLMDAGYKGVFTLEATETLRPADYWLGNRHTYPQDQRLKNAPVFLKQEAEKLLFDTATYILDQYGLSE